MSVISFMPYFPDRQMNHTYGDFRIWNWHNYKNEYVTDKQMLAYLDNYFRIYQTPNGTTEDRVAVISLLSDGVLFGEVDDIRRLHIGRFAAASMLAHLSALPKDQNDGLFASSSDNFLALFQPFELGSVAFALEFGSYFRASWAASNIDRLHFLTPQYMPDPGAAPRDNELLMHLAALCSSNQHEVDRIFRALDWCRFAFTNVDEHPYEARIVSIATAFEILLDMPEEQKAEHFSKQLNALLPSNRLPVTSRLVNRGKKGKKKVIDNQIGWWCRHLYELRSKIVHGDKVQRVEYFSNGVDDLKIALYLFVECVWGLLRKIGVVNEADCLSFWFRAGKWIDALQLPHEAFD